jgi:N-acetylglucosamine-6-phosphate deacetylase
MLSRRQDDPQASETLVLTGGRLMLDHGLAEGRALVVESGRIRAILPEREAIGLSGRSVDLQGGRLLPGFIDTQVNGGGGALFNDDPSPETIRQIAEAHRRYGATSLLPTVISDDLHVLDAAIRAVDATIAQGVPGVIGIHVEGPFISADRKGVHDESKVRILDREAVALLTSLKQGRTVVTLAPETTEPRLIRSLVEAGVIVSIGHTDGAYADIRMALDCGATGFTHLFNAMSPMQNRAPGAVGAALESLTAWCGIIVDGKHVDPVVLKIALRTRPHNRFMLLTDAMPTVGSPDKRFTLQGREIVVEDGVCVAPDGTLAGSDLDMASAVRNAVAMLDLDLAEASRMASRYPAEFLGLGGELGRIAEGYRANLVLVDDDLRVVESWIDGRPTPGS